MADSEATAGAGTRMTAAEAVIRTMARNGIDTIFCLPGVQNDFLFDALHGAQGTIRALHTRHEQGAAYMALGAAMATGKPAAYAVVPGPGVLNTTAALCTAYACNAPVLALTGQIPSPYIGRGLGFLHEIPDQLGILRSLTKWAERIRSPQEAPGLVTEAFRQLRSGRPRPVALECPLDVWPRAADVALPEGPAQPRTAPIDPDAVAAAAALLGKAERPLIVIGGGALDAGPELLAIAEALQAPVVAHRMGLGALDGRHPLSVNGFLGYRLWAEADVVLAVGTRLQLQLMQWGTDAGAQGGARSMPIPRRSTASSGRRWASSATRRARSAPSSMRCRRTIAAAPRVATRSPSASGPPRPRSRGSSRRRSGGSMRSAPSCRRTASSSMS